MKLAVFGLASLLGLSTFAHADAVSDFMQQRKVLVNKAKAELCFEDTKDCHPVLVGKATPLGKFDLNIYKTNKPGYGGDIIGFKQQGDFLFALHRVWTRIRAERRLERIASLNPADRMITNGCINVTNDVYDRLKGYFVLEII